MSAKRGWSHHVGGRRIPEDHPGALRSIAALGQFLDHDADMHAGLRHHRFAMAQHGLKAPLQRGLAHHLGDGTVLLGLIDLRGPHRAIRGHHDAAVDDGGGFEILDRAGLRDHRDQGKDGREYHLLHACIPPVRLSCLAPLPAAVRYPFALVGAPMASPV